MKLMSWGALALLTGLAWVQEASADGRPEAILLASYTQNKSVPVATTVVKVSVADGFSAKERTDISEALAEWNHTLNGHLRFDLREDVTRGGLTVVRVPDKDLPLNGPAAQWLAVTMRGQGDTGLMMVYGDRIGRYDLRRIMLHEVGHFLGLAHDDHTNLMFPRYIHGRQGCIDRTTVQRLAGQRHWEIEELNWCDPVLVASRPKIEGSGEWGAAPTPRQARPGSERRPSRGGPGAHDVHPPDSDDSDDPPELECPHTADWPIDNQPWSQWMTTDFIHRVLLRMSAATP